MPFTKLISVYETVLLAGRDVLMNFNEFESEVRGFLLVLKNKSTVTRRDDLKMIRWLVLFLQDLLRSFNFNILFPKHNLKCPFCM